MQQNQSNQSFFEQLLRGVVKIAVIVAVGVVLDPITGLSLALAALA